MPSLIDRTGRRYGRLLVIERDRSAGPASHGKRVRWICRCECGQLLSCAGHELASGDVRSCGCLRRDELRERQRNHGLVRTGAHSSWAAAKARCYDPKHTAYAAYGGRGIRMCPRWREDFRAFLSDMGERPAGMSIDRVDPNGHYEPSNCRWAPPEVQAANKRRALQVWKGRSQRLADIAAEIGVPRTTLGLAFRQKGSIDDAVAHVLARRASQSR